VLHGPEERSQELLGRAHVNFLRDEGPERMGDHRDNYDRLAQIKAARDPDTAFRASHDIAPRT
jgi:hypothetical protein